MKQENGVLLFKMMSVPIIYVLIEIKKVLLLI